MNIVTKSGTNGYAGSCFTLFRDKSLNAHHPPEAGGACAKADYRRYQFGGCSAARSCRTGAFYFVAAERTQQDTNQAVEHLGLYPGS